VADEDISWKDVGKAIAIVALAVGAKSLIDGQKKQKSQGTDVPYPESEPEAWILCGDWVKVGGKYLFYETYNEYFGTVRAINDGRVEFKGEYYLNDDLVTIDGDGWVISVNGESDGGDGRYVDERVQIKTRAGLPTETAYSEIIDKWPSLWDSDSRGDDTATVMMICRLPKQEFRAQAFPNGHPTLYTIARGVCYDWRKDTTAGGTGDQRRDDDTTWEPSPNPVVWRVHLEWFRFAEDWNEVIAPVLTDLTEAADYCDDLVAIVGGTQPRYRFAYKYAAGTDPAEVRRVIDASMAAWCTHDADGCLVVLPGGYEAPEYTITDQHLIDWDWSEGHAVESGIDSLIISFTDPANGYNTNQCDQWIISAEGTRTDTLDLTAVSWWQQARRLAKIAASEIMPAAYGSVSTDVSGLAGLGKRYIGVESGARPRMANIVGKVSNAPEFDGLTGRFTYPLISAGASAYAWTPAVEEGSAPGVTDRNVPVSLPKPEVDSVSSFFDDVTSTGSGLRLRIDGTVSGVARGDLTWIWYWRVKDSGNAFANGTDLDGDGLDMVTGFVPSNATLEVRVQYRTGGGTTSPMSDVVEYVTSLAGRLDFRDPLNSALLALLDDF